MSSLQILELVENQERIDELVRKTEKNESRNRNPFQSTYLGEYSFNLDYDLNNRPQLNQSQSSYLFKTQSPSYYSINQVNNINYDEGIKYSLPTKYEPIKYNKPKIIYSSMTAKRNFEQGQYKTSSRVLNNLYSKYGFK